MIKRPYSVLRTAYCAFEIRSKRLLRLLAMTAIVLPILLTSASAYAVIIKKVEFTGQHRVPMSTLQTTVRSRVGYIYRASVVSDDIKALYRLGQFENIVVEEDSVKGGIKLTYILTEKPYIIEVDFEGNKKIKDDDLREDIVVGTYKPIQGEEVTESCSKILQAYAKKGYYLAECDFYVQDINKGQAKLIFEIKENAGAIVREVRFVGNTVFKDRKLRKGIKTRRKGLFAFLTGSGKYSEEALNNDIMRLTIQYLNVGYLKVKVSAPKTTISSDKRYIFVTFSIKEGEQYRVGNVDLSGNILTTKPEMMSKLKTKEGNIYSQMKLQEDLSRFADLYGNQGYAFANVYPDIKPNDETLTADITFYISKGSKIKVQKINITGNDKTRDKVIRRELEIKEDDQYNSAFIAKSREKLMRLGYFEEVNFATPRGTSDDAVNLDINVKERSTGSFNIGIGFSTFENFMFTGAIQQANFFGTGISGQASAQISSRRQFFFLTAKDPFFMDTKLMLGASVFHTAYHYPDFWKRQTGADMTFGRRFWDKFTAEVGYKVEDVSIANFSSVVPQFFRQDTGGLTSAFTFGLVRDGRDNMLTPKQGTYNQLTAEVSASQLGAENEYFRIKYKSMYYQPIWKKRLIFKAFGRIGWIKSLGDKPVPLYERFFLGGSYDLRGYFPNSVGPSLRVPIATSGGDTRFTYGGNKELLLIGELEFIIHEKAGVSVVAFFDAGDAYAEDENYFSTMRMDYGFGVRWNSPMGPLRFEWGIPINKRSTDNSVQFNFTMGNIF